VFVTTFGEVKQINTTGGAETWVQGDILYYNPLVTGGLTKTKPAVPNAITVVAAVVHVGASNGVLFVRPTYGSVLGGTDGNVNFTSLASGNTLIYDAVAGVWENANLTAGTAISVTNGAGSITIANTGVTSAIASTGISVSSGTGAVTFTNTAPDQTVVLTAGTGISTSGTYPNFTITNTAPDQIVSLTGAGTTSISGTYPSFTITSNDQFVGTVTSVSGTGTVNGISLSGTVTSSGNLTLGGALTGVDLASQVTGTLPIANGGTGTVTPALVAGTNVSITGSWPNQTINSSNPGGTVTSVDATVPSFLSITGGPITTSGTLAISYSGTALPVTNGGTGTSTPALVAGTNISITGAWPNQTINSSSSTTNAYAFAWFLQ
jgi:hypothetical protein